MSEDKPEPEELHIVRSDATPNAWHCSYTAPARDTFSAKDVLHLLAAAIGNCWFALPEGGKNVAVLEREMKRLLDLTVENLRAHPQAFGIESGPLDPSAADIQDGRFRGDATMLMLHLAIESCGKMLPIEQRNVDSIERDIRILFEQSLGSLRADPAGFIPWP